MKPEQKHKLIRLIEKERIHFHGPDHLRPGKHASVFSAVQHISTYKFDQYVFNFAHEAHQKPWRGKIKKQVEHIVRLAEDCRYARQNELGWRLKLESEILARFGTEVTCKRCSSKLWRSEVEVFFGSSDKFVDALDLEKRQASRKPCSCSETQRHLDIDDPGICRIFHDRADEMVRYDKDDPISGALPAEQKPDRVFGFRKTSRFRRLLDEEMSDPKFEGQELRDTLECSPFHEMRDQVLFPFLVLEAKSETGDSFDDIEIQTAFAIKKLLDIQHKLHQKTGAKSQWQSGPLVWFLSNRGHDWRIAAACVDVHDDTVKYHVHPLWTGGITSRDASLQLLLLVDYIFDWARDFQREAILNELRIYAGRNASSVARDSEIRSLGAPMQRFLETDFEQCLMENQADFEGSGPQHNVTYQWLDKENCLFRSISWAYARLSALYITKENLQTLLRSFPSRSVAQKHARDLLRLFREAWRVSPEALQAIEFMWTGNVSEDPDLYGGPRSLCAVFTVAAYFQSDWEQVLELTYIAIAEDTFDDLKAYVDMHQPIRVYPSELPRIQDDQLIGWFQHFRQSSVRSRFHAVMKRRCLSSRLAREKDHPNDFFLLAMDYHDRGIDFRFDVTMLPDQSPKTRRLVAAVYDQCKRGMREPVESFLRMSSTYDCSTRNHRDMPSVWGSDDLTIREDSQYICLGSGDVANNQDVHVCIYVLDDIPDPQPFQLCIDSIETCFVVQPNLRIKSSSSKVEWNTTVFAESISSESAMLRHLKTHLADVVIEKKNNLTYSTTIESVKHPTYHATDELPPHMRTRVRNSGGRWVTVGNSQNPYKFVRSLANDLVARRRNVKMITYLYTGMEAGRQEDLGPEQWQVPTTKSDRLLIASNTSKEAQELRGKSPEGKREHILHSRDNFDLLRPKRERGEESDNPNEKWFFGSGDWLSDQELAQAIREGMFQGRDEPIHVKDESTEPSPKRRRMTGFGRDSQPIEILLDGLGRSELPCRASQIVEISDEDE